MAKKKILEKATKAEQIEAVVEVAEKTPDVENKKRRVNFSRKIVLNVIIVIVIITALAVAGMFYVKYQEAVNQSKDIAGVADAAESEQLIKSISKIVELPSGEVPTIATVSDINELSGQAFFADAKNGDRVLIFNVARKAYLYRPETGKIINIGPVSGSTPSNPEVSASPSPEVAEPARVLILNGTSKAGLARTAEAALTDANIEDIEFSARGNTTGDYENVIIVDVSGNYEAQADEIASALSGEIGKLPDAETIPQDIDIVVILGTSFTEQD